MSMRFWIQAAIFHAALLSVVALCLGRWLRRDLAAQSRLRFLLAVAADLLVCGALGFFLAFPMAAPIRDRAFAIIRLWSQALFLEGPLYLCLLALIQWRSQRSRRVGFLAVPALVLLGTYVFAYHVEPRRLQVEQHEVKLSPEPAPGPGLRLLHISDIQAHRIGDYERRVVREAAALEPDLVVLTGDYVQERLRPTGEQTARELVELWDREGPRPPLGVFAVGGDTGDFGVAELLRGIGVRWLDDELVTVPGPGGRPLALIGLTRETSWGQRPERIRQLLAQAPPRAVRVVFGHAPDYVLGLSGEDGVDLALAGHTHGGQIVLPFFGPPLTLSGVPRRVAGGGLHELHGVKIHVSRGVGMERGSAPQIRFLCPPEICVLTLR